MRNGNLLKSHVSEILVKKPTLTKDLVYMYFIMNHNLRALILFKNTIIFGQYYFAILATVLDHEWSASVCGVVVWFIRFSREGLFINDGTESLAEMVV